MQEIIDIVNQFQIKGQITRCDRFGNGLINHTFIVETTKEKYILQEINNYVFKDVDMLMNNIALVTNHLKNKGVETLEFIDTKYGKNYLKSGDKYYRLSVFVKDIVCYEKAESLEMVYSSGEAFGEFHALLKDLDSSQIGEVIPNFHNTKQRFLNFKNSIDIASIDRKEKAKEEIKALLGMKKYVSLIVDAIREKKIPLTISHNDSKINNILFDKNDDSIRLIIDLDTIMPGSVLYDFGDALRSLFSGENEDNIDPSTCHVKFDIYKAYLSGYLSKARSSLNDEEKRLLPWAPLLMTLECAFRFLEDYLRGDKYFQIKYEEHNLVRARTQIYLANDFLAKMDELENITKEITKI